MGKRLVSFNWFIFLTLKLFFLIFWINISKINLFVVLWILTYIDVCVNTSEIRKLNSSITTKSLSCSLYSHTLPQILAAAAKLCQLCPTLCDPIDRRQPTRLPHPWSSPSKNTGVGCYFLLQCMKVKSLSHVRLFTTPWTVAYQASPSMGFSRQEYWSGLPCPSPSDPGVHWL